MTTRILILDPDAATLAGEVREVFETQTGRPAPPFLEAPAVEALDGDAPAADVLLAPPDLAAQAVPRLPRLRWIQSTWAGVTPILAALRARSVELTGASSDVPRGAVAGGDGPPRGASAPAGPGGNGAPAAPVVTAAKGLFGPRMAEYVFGWLAAIERRLLDYRDVQRACRWQRLQDRDMAGRTLLLAGTGSIGAHLAHVAAAFRLRVIGVSRQGRPQTGFERVGPPAALAALLAEADYVVSSLPDTPATQGFFDAAAFAAMKSDAIFVNVGRGAVVDEAALVATLGRNHLRAAVLDVFACEPLAPDHAFWQTPRLFVTPHVAAFTPREGIVRLFADNLARYLTGAPLHGVVDIEHGY